MIKARLMVRRHEAGFGYADQMLYTMQFDINPPSTIVFCGMVFEFDRFTTGRDWVFVAGMQHPKVIELLKGCGGLKAGQHYWVREVVPHGGNTDDSHQYVTMTGVNIPSSIAKVILP